MRPTHPILYPAYRVFTNTVFGCDFSLQARISADRMNLRLGQFRGSALLAPIRRSVFYPVSLIRGSGIPTKIFQSIVRNITIVVATLILVLGWADKGKQYEPMNLHQLVGIVFPQENKQAPILAVARGLFHSPALDVFHAPEVGNFIGTLIPKNRLPSLHFQTPLRNGNWDILA